MSHASHPPLFDHFNYTWRRVKVMKLLIMQLSPCHFIPLWSKYSPKHPVLKHSQSMFSVNIRKQVTFIGWMSPIFTFNLRKLHAKRVSESLSLIISIFVLMRWAYSKVRIKLCNCSLCSYILRAFCLCLLLYRPSDWLPVCLRVVGD
jgi:hypothetical protein